MALNLVIVTERNGKKRKLPPLPLRREKPVYSESSAGSLPFVSADKKDVKIRLEYCDDSEYQDLREWLERKDDLRATFAVSSIADNNSDTINDTINLKKDESVAKDEGVIEFSVDADADNQTLQLFALMSGSSYAVSITFVKDGENVTLYSGYFICAAFNVALVSDNDNESVLLPVQHEPPVSLENGAVRISSVSVSVDNKYKKICLEFCDKANGDDKEVREKREKLEEWIKN